MNVNLCDLPTELLTNILLKLDFLSLLRVQPVNRLIYAIIKEHKVLQYTIELGIAGMVDGPADASLTTEERLRGLEHYQKMWRHLTWSKHDVIPMEGGNIWELAGGVLAQGKPPTQIGSTDMVFNQLPSPTRRIEARSWSLHFDVHVRDFTIDPFQDLIVLISETYVQASEDWCISLHFRTMSSNHNHPLAKAPLIRCSVPDSPGSYVIAVCQTYVGLLCSMSMRNFEVDGSDMRFFIWDWCTGQVQVDQAEDIYSFAFLSNRHVLIAIPTREDPPEDTEVSAALVIVDFQKRAALSSQTCFVVSSFHLPEISEGFGIRDVLIRSDPSFSFGQQGDDSTPSAPFQLSPENRIFVITFELSNTRKRPILVVPLSTFVPHLNNVPVESSISERWRQLGVRWSDWGSQGSRMLTLHNPLSLTWVCYVYGSRFVYHTPGNGLSMVFDFNPWSVHSKPDDRSEMRVINWPTTINLDHFSERVTTHLPFTAIMIHGIDRSFTSAGMLTEDHLITVDDLTQREFHVHVF
ncbi:hypothetical protein BD410DRAFT_782245 [Rickenella mellea]|uniref:F-box domain-containing protein n=1 Tax=Rickenella mellea TaxID=50990 RepID=A0A4Y7QN29_9AGAM|nr:hypothetical protein BD410DRAFT_782245 [Rickenella mellea]